MLRKKRLKEIAVGMTLTALVGFVTLTASMQLVICFI